jgi:cysteine synthase A
MTTALGGAPDVAVIGVGSGATLRAWASVLRAAGPTRVIGVTAAQSDTRLAGLAGPRAIADADETRTVDDARAWHTAERLAREEGLLVGPSAGACVAVACDVAATLPASARVATILGDTGERYFSIARFFPAEPRS